VSSRGNQNKKEHQRPGKKRDPRNRSTVRGKNVSRKKNRKTQTRCEKKGRENTANWWFWVKEVTPLQNRENGKVSRKKIKKNKKKAGEKSIV